MDYHREQQELVNSLRQKGIKDEMVLRAIAKTPRHLFISPDMQEYAYQDSALPIECHQTISQPFVVALMTEAILSKGKVRKVLEIGTGSGYQAAILAQLVPEVYTIERIKPLLMQAEARFAELNLKNIHTLFGDGNLGWPEHAPFDAIIVTAAAPEIPKLLWDQLDEEGRMVIPVNESVYGAQELRLLIRHHHNIESIMLEPVVFVPLLSGKQD